jgi:hypothetical protein
MWWGGWLLYNNPEKYEFNDFLISNFALLFSLFGLGTAFQDMSDRKEMEKSASRIFYLLDRKSSIDPLGSDGKILNTTSTSNKMNRKSSVRRKKSVKASGLSEKSNAEAADDIPEPVTGKKKRLSKKKSSKKLEADASNSNPESLIKQKSLKKKKKKSQKKDDEADD